ncbi:MAG TPA: glycosyltransferase family 4 protein [Chthoniobacterales bacterium]|nr:glycosyltransferase family 4 protein [Chthoniobacterales bacterium]
MIVLSHPTGNANVRAVLDALDRAGLLARFVTTLGWSKKSYPVLADHIHGKLRRNYAVSADKIDIHPAREAIRLLAGSLGLLHLTAGESAWASIDQVAQSLDREAARRLRRGDYGANVRAAYAYEDCAEQQFTAARDLGLRRVYDLPIAYWETSQRLLREEAQRYPKWESTLGGTRDSEAKLARKTRELALAELIICPSKFVVESLPPRERATKEIILAPFGSPTVNLRDSNVRSRADNRPLRVLFAGTLTQRKGLADLFAGMKLIDSSQVELVLMGSLLRPLVWYRKQFPHFVYQAPRAHSDVLRLMQTCDVLVLPSIVEGRALVQQEAMASGLPVVATRNAGADDVIVEGETGFLVPIRSPEAIAEKLTWFLANRSRITQMSVAAQRRAAQLTWRGYGEIVVRAISGLLKIGKSMPAPV